MSVGLAKLRTNLIKSWWTKLLGILLVLQTLQGVNLFFDRQALSTIAHTYESQTVAILRFFQWKKEHQKDDTSFQKFLILRISFHTPLPINRLLGFHFFMGLCEKIPNQPKKAYLEKVQQFKCKLWNPNFGFPWNRFAKIKKFATL